jgi:aminopeptidase YwaD
MIVDRLRNQAEFYLEKLCVTIDSRRVSSQGNRAATDFFARTISAFGFETETSAFDCIDWRQDGVTLTATGASFTAFASPYTLGCWDRASLLVVPTIEALETEDVANKIILLCQEITREQLMPKNFPFYNPEHHQWIIHLLETKRPVAVIAATARDLDMVGGAIYPFPLTEMVSGRPRPLPVEPETDPGLDLGPLGGADSRNHPYTSRQTGDH